MNRMIPSPPQPAPIGNGTYTTWPGGVDPTARLFNTDNQKIPCTGTAVGGARRRRSTRKANRKAHRKGSRKVGGRRCWSRRIIARKARKATRKSRRCWSRRN